MSTDNKKLNDKASSLLEDLKENFGGLFEEYKEKKEEFKDQPDKLNEFLSSDDWRNKFKKSTKSNESWCRFFGFVKSTYEKICSGNGFGNTLDTETKKGLKDVDAFFHLEKFQGQYKGVFDEWLELDQQDRENKAGNSSIDLNYRWQELMGKISDIGKWINKRDKRDEMKNLALENPNFDTMLKFCDKVEKLLGIDLTKYLLRDFESFVGQFKEVFLEFEKAGCMKLDNLPTESEYNKNKKTKGKDADYWKKKINSVKHNVKKVEVRKLTDDEWRSFLWDNRMNFTHEQVRQLGFISDQDGYTDRFTLHRLADFVCFVPKSGYGHDHDIVHDLRFFSFYMGDSWSWKKKNIKQLFKYNLDINVNKNLQIKDGTPVEYLFGHDVELLMKDISKLEINKFDCWHYSKLVKGLHDRLVTYLCAIDPEHLTNTVLSENSYVPNQVQEIYKKIDSKERFNNMFGKYAQWSDEYCDYKYLLENLYSRMQDIVKMQDEDDCKEAIKNFVDSMSEKIFNFSKRNRESYLKKQNKLNENIDIEYEANRYALWSFYKIIIEITNEAEKEEKAKEQKDKNKNKKQKEENNKHNELKKVISEFKTKWLAKFNSILKITDTHNDNKGISNKKLKEFMEFMYPDKYEQMYLKNLDLIQHFAEKVGDDGEFEKNAVPSVDLIKNFLYDVFGKNLIYLKNNDLESWKFNCAYKVINKLPSEWLSNRDNLISLLVEYGGNNKKLLNNKFDGWFSELNTGFGFFGFNQKQKRSILDKIGEIKDECVFYAFISECIIYESNEAKVDVEMLQLIMKKTEVYGLGLQYCNNSLKTIDDRIYDKMKEIVESISKSDLAAETKKKVLQNISDLYFNKFYYSNRNRCDSVLFGVELDKEIYKSSENKPTKADIICKAMKESKISGDWFCKFLENSITLARCNYIEVDVSQFNVKEALYADEDDIVDILLDPDKFEFCKKKYEELKPSGTAFNSFDTIENAIRVLNRRNCKLYWEEYCKKNEVYFKKCEAKVLAGEDLDIDGNKKGIIESIKVQVTKHELCYFSLCDKKLKCSLNFKPVDYFYLFDEETQKNLIKGACAGILKEIDSGNKNASEHEICLSDRDNDFGLLLSLAKKSGNLDIFLEDDFAIKLFDAMHNQFNNFEFEFYQNMISVDKNGELLQHILTKKRIYRDKKNKNKRLPLYRLLISNDREDIKELQKQAEDAYKKYSEAYDDWEKKDGELKEQEKADKKTKNKDKKSNTKKENKDGNDEREINKNMEQMESEVAKADKKQEELYKDYEAIDNKLAAMKEMLTEDDKNKLNTIAKDLFAKIRENKDKKDKNVEKHTEFLDDAFHLLANLLGEIKLSSTTYNFFDVVVDSPELDIHNLFRIYMLALSKIEKTDTQLDKTTIRDLLIEFIDFWSNELLDNVLEQKEKASGQIEKKLGVALASLRKIYAPTEKDPYYGLSQDQFRAVIEIFVNMSEKLRNEGIKVAELLIEKTPLQKLVEDKNCKLDVTLVERIKKLLDKNQEKEILNKAKENKEENPDIGEDKDGIDKKDKNESAKVINELKAEQKNTNTLEIKNTEENAKSVVNKDNIINNDDNKDNRATENDIGKKGENDINQSQSPENYNEDKKELGQINKSESANIIMQAEFSQNAKQSSDQPDIIKEQNNANLRNEKDNNSDNNNGHDEEKDIINNEGQTPQNINLKSNENDNFGAHPQATTKINAKNNTTITNNNVGQTNTEISSNEQNKATETETADNNNTSQGMGYTAPVGSTAVSTALWLIFVFAQAGLLLIAAIIFTAISVILWARKIYTDKIKKNEQLTDLSEQYKEESHPINNNLLQQYKNMKENEKAIEQVNKNKMNEMK